MSSASVIRNFLKYNVFNHKNVAKLNTQSTAKYSSSATSGATTLNETPSTEHSVTDVKRKLIEYMGLERGYRKLQKNRQHLLELLPTSRAELPPRTMQDSFTSAIIPLSTDVEMQEKYVTFLGQVRLGRLMEDMDIFSVWVAHKHILNPRQSPGDSTPYVIVTVLVDQIDFTDILPKHDADIRLSGHVSYVGLSSIETTVWLEQKMAGEWQRITRATFLMAARNATNTAAAIVNTLVAETEREKGILLKAETRKKDRISRQHMSLLKQVPDVNEQHVIHGLFLETVDHTDALFHKRTLPPHTLWMDEAKLGTIVLCHPEDRNMHNRVFGGFLMRQALELSHTLGYYISKYRPKLKHISDIGFHKPVAIGSMLRMNAQVVYSEFNFMQIVVSAEVFEPHSGLHRTTNMFHYTFETAGEAVKVMPQSYSDAMTYLDGRRHFQQVMKLVT